MPRDPSAMRADIDRLDATITRAGHGQIRHDEVSLALQALGRIMADLRALTTCDCGMPRLLGGCSEFCDRED